MRLTINKPDGVVGIDGHFVDVDLSTLDKNIRAVQWHGTHGHIEFNDLSNKIINSILEFAEIYSLAKSLVATEIELIKAQEKADIEEENNKQKYLSQVAILENNNAELDYEYISKLINEVSFAGLTLGVRVRISDNKAIGIDVLNAVKLEDESGEKTLYAIRELFKFCQKMKVPFMTDVQPSLISIDRYAEFLKSLGATIYKFEFKNKYYAQFTV